MKFNKLIMKVNAPYSSTSLSIPHTSHHLAGPCALFSPVYLKVRAVAIPEWAPFFLNYKLLKKKIKDIRTQRQRDQFVCSTTDNVAASETGRREMRYDSPWRDSIEGNSSVIVFFRALYAELIKVSTFYGATEEELYMRFQRAKEGVRQLEENRLEVTNDELNILVMMGMKKITRDLLMLQNYAIVSFTGFSKILKKHDKNSGFVTRSSFMNRLILQHSFVQCAKVKQMINDLNEMFHRIQNIVNPKLLEDERLFISAILNMKDSCESMKREEECCSTSDGTSISDKDDSPKDQLLTHKTVREKRTSAVATTPAFMTAGTVTLDVGNASTAPAADDAGCDTFRATNCPEVSRKRCIDDGVVT